ncbi:SDR family NAD(P)-dependent oxidoreductase [Spirillospora sp. NPDC127200]
MASPPRPRQEPVAVVGASALMPGSRDVEGFWRTVVDGDDLVRDVPPSHWLLSDHHDPDPAAPDRTYGTRGAFLDPVPFDPLAYGMPPAALPATDTTQLLTLIAAGRLLGDLERGSPGGLDRERVSVILGLAPLELLTSLANRTQRPVWTKALRESGLPESQVQQVCDRIADHYVPWTEASFPGLLSNVVAGRVANRFDLHGSNFVTDAACAGSLAAVATAVNELALGQADLVITGGADTLNDIVMYMCFSKTPALSRTGDCRPFSADSDGTILGEGVILFALKRLADAERDGDQIYAVLRGMGSSSDGRGTAVYAPVPAGQARALRRAYEAAGYGPDTVELLEAHGTGTLAGDAAECAALREVFTASGRTDPGWCALGSVKSQVGHTKSTAGAAGLLKVVLALHHRVLPPTIKVSRPNPKLGLDDGPLYLNTEARPWVRDSAHPRRASVSSFGFGGSNFHATLEEYTGTAPQAGRRLRAAPSELIPLSAPTADDLVALCRQSTDDDVPLATLARDAQQGFDPSADTRLTLVATDRADYDTRLRQAAERIAARPDEPFDLPGGVHYRTGPAPTGEIAFLFPGQGSQYTGMGAGLAMHLPTAQEVWDRGADVDLGDAPLHRVVFPPPAFTDEERAAQEERLTATQWAQPALAAHSAALLAVLRDLEVRPDCLAGHSLGELVALHAAGSLDLAALLRLARRRGELMAAATAEPGGMLSVRAGWTDVVAAIEAAAVPELWAVNQNAPEQTVVAGRRDALERFAQILADDGVRSRPLAVSAAFHSPLVAEAAGPLRDLLTGLDLAAPALDVYGNADAEPYPCDPDRVRDRIAEQLAAPVRFAAQIEAMYERGVRTFVEVGPGSVLTGLVTANLGGRDHLAAALDRRGRHGLTALHEGLALLAAHGVPLRLEALWDRYAPRPEPAPPASAATVMICGANYGKPYPPPGGEAALPPPNPEPLDQEPSPPGQLHQERPPTGPDPYPSPPERPEVTTHPVQAGHQTPAEPLPRPDEPAPPAQNGHVRPVQADGAWLQTIQEIQRQTAEVQTAYHQFMAQSQLAFLATAEACLTGLENGHIPPAGQSGGAPANGGRSHGPLALPPAQPTNGTLMPYAPLSPAPAPPAAMPPAAMPPAPMAPAPMASATMAPAPMPAAPMAPPVEPAAPVPPPASAPAAESEPPQAADGPDLGTLVIEVVAEKTGYPAEILTPDMHLEGDLGIDSIKRVEILSAVRGRAPDLPEVDAAELARLQTLGEVVARLDGAAPAAGNGTGGAPSGIGAGSSAAAEKPDPPPEHPGIVRRFGVRETPAPPSGLRMAGLTARRVVITDDHGGIAEHLAALLREQGVAAETAQEVPQDADGVVLLNALRPLASPDDALRTAREAFRAARTVAPHMARHGGLFVTVQDTGGDFGLSGRQGDRAWSGGLAGLARTAALEWPHASVKAIDCDRGDRGPEQVAAALARELLAGGLTPDVGLHADGTRTTLATYQDSAPETAGPPELARDSVVVVSGGARGVTAQAVLALARAAGPRLVLLGRTPLEPEPAHTAAAADQAAVRRALVDEYRRRGQAPPRPAELGAEAGRILAVREIQARLRELADAGATARYENVDVTDAAAVARVLDRVRADWGPITGLVHGAGVLADKPIADQTDAAFAAVFDTKVEGLRALLTATSGDPLAFLCLFSSVAGQYGNAGQCAYAMANEVLCQVAAAERARDPDRRAHAVCWGPWDGGMVGPELAARFAAQGIGLIAPRAGAEAFVADLATAHDGRRVVLAAGEDPSGSARRGAARRRARLRLAPDTHPELGDHLVAGVPVVPFVVALDWLSGAAYDLEPGGTGLTLRDVRVLRRLDLPDFGDRPHEVEITIGPAGGTAPATTLEITSGDHRHYRAALAPAPGPPRPRTAPDGLEPADRDDVYTTRGLHHGPLLRSLRTLRGLSEHGADAELAGTVALGWADPNRPTDPAALDGVMKLATLWGARVLGENTLPMSLAEFRLHRRGPVGDGARCLLRARQVGADHAVCDAVLTDGRDGEVRAELLGITVVRRPD